MRLPPRDERRSRCRVSSNEIVAVRADEPARAPPRRSPSARRGRARARRGRRRTRTAPAGRRCAPRARTLARFSSSFAVAHLLDRAAGARHVLANGEHHRRRRERESEQARDPDLLVGDGQREGERAGGEVVRRQPAEPLTTRCRAGGELSAMLIAAVSSETLTTMYTTPARECRRELCGAAPSPAHRRHGRQRRRPRRRGENCAASKTPRLQAASPRDEHDAPSGAARSHRGADAEDEAHGEEAGAGEARRAAAVHLDLDELENDRQDEEGEESPMAGTRRRRHESTASNAMSAAAADATTEMRTFGSRRPPTGRLRCCAVVTRSPLGHDGRSRELNRQLEALA